VTLSAIVSVLLYSIYPLIYGQSSSAFPGDPGHSAVMSDEAAMLHAKWVTAQDSRRFQELLNAETEDGQYNILIALLSRTAADKPKK
jgi:hypothetical protein